MLHSLLLQAKVLKDISESLNFTYEIRPPTDGNLWGEFFANGSATGLVRDVKVRLFSKGSLNYINFKSISSCFPITFPFIHLQCE